MLTFLYNLWLWFTKPAELIAWLGSSTKPVERSVAVARLEVCEGCPLSLPGGKAAEMAAVTLKRMAVMKGRMGLSIPGETENFCMGCGGCKISAKIWVQHSHIKAYQSTSTYEKIKAVRPECWQL